MRPDDPPLPDEAIDQLVAYLDGELPAAEAAAVEARLAHDTAFRTALQQMDRAWNALDQLPRSTVGEGFANTTIEMAAVEAERDLATLTAVLPVRRQRIRYLGLAVGLGLGLVGFALARGAGATAKQEREMIFDLPTVFQVDALRQSQSLEFLEQLVQNRSEVCPTLETDEIAQLANAWGEMAAGSPMDRHAWVESLAPPAKADLAEKLRRYQGLSEKERDRLRQLDQAISASEKSAALRRAAVAHQAWVSQFSPATQAELRESDIDDRIDKIRELLGDPKGRPVEPLTAQESQRLRDAVRRLDSEGVLEGFAETTKQLALRPPAPLERMPPEFRNEFSKRLQRAAESPLRLIMLLARVATFDPGHPMLQEERAKLAPTWDKVEAELIAALDPERRGKLPANKSERARRLFDHLTEASRDSFESDMESFFASDAVTQSERLELLAMPTSEMKNSLRSLYVERELAGLGEPPRGFDPLRGPWGGPWGKRDRGPEGRRFGRP